MSSHSQTVELAEDQFSHYPSVTGTNMAPRIAKEDDDPVTAEYDVYLTPSQAEQILLLQYPNRTRNRPYNVRHGARPQNIRIKPDSGYLEVDVNLNTTFNFNKFKGLQWGDTLNTARDVQNAQATYGPAAGFSNAKPRSAGRILNKNWTDRELQYENDLTRFGELEAESKVLKTQTLGGQIIRHSAAEEAGKPHYFVGAFRDDQLHLTKVDGTVQMRPQFHHLDAEDQRARLAALRAADLPAPTGEARALLQRERKVFDEVGKDRLEDRTKRLLLAAEAEVWSRLDYVDEDDQAAYDKFHERMFVSDVDGASRLESAMNQAQYTDAMSAPRKDGPGVRRRKKVAKTKKGETVDIDDGDGEEDEDEDDAHGGAQQQSTVGDD
ncbi:hypothetical protein BAUCODRAFT_152115 [Baudoinia panamericana UAMH 10762]|uniref:DNA-directed RNA polymerase III subunit Rpc5 n=1 Tax=Baudoinia panamericana (strain UAMH 10762) TaxID=717646 RepID=M2LCN5_BAUPA|nr:uncharacterized protein BAUCODRAFT_152115 [Baudoinia panamericana UAMH 10762]EMC91727.1 hypothetical protein BAUCODRAFT_152115 [Baudoinia panamericana UAMH 10762]